MGERTINQERNLRVQAELRVTPASISPDKFTTDETKFPTVEQENKVNFFCNSLLDMANLEKNRQTVNTITDSSSNVGIEVINDAIDSNDESKYMQMDGIIRQLFEMQQ